jgi:hypothetical protein
LKRPRKTIRRSENDLQLGRRTILRLGDAELTEHVAKMNRAPEDKKTDLTAAVHTHMVEQRITMDARKAKVEEEMMKHMRWAPNPCRSAR